MPGNSVGWIKGCLNRIKIKPGQRRVEQAAMSVIDSCPFCAIDPARSRAEDELIVSYLDGFPISSSHTLILPRRHIAALFDATKAAQTARLQSLSRAKMILDESRHPDGCSIGINHGEASGQNIAHLHIHLIPRYRGDQEYPRGEVRWVLPEKARYWE